MAYVSQERKAQLAPAIKAICKKHGVKASLAVRHHSTLVLNISTGAMDFCDSYNRTMAARSAGQPEHVRPQLAKGYIQVNPYWYREHFDGPALAFLREVIPAMNVGNHDNSEAMTDYFDVGWYVSVNIGRWDKPYEVQHAANTPQQLGADDAAGMAHHVNGTGSYDGSSEHTVHVTASLDSGVRLQISGPNRNDVKDAIAGQCGRALTALV